MNDKLIFKFESDLSGIEIPTKLNNPFGTQIPEIAKIAAEEFQEVIIQESQEWAYDFEAQKGKMFGVLVVQNKRKELNYLGTISGRLPKNIMTNRFVPSVFDDSTGDYFINKGMIELTEIRNQIKGSNDPLEILLLKEKSREKSKGLQRRLFENYHFLNLSGEKKNLLEVFAHSRQGNPPSAAGECAGPKLLQYAIEQNLKPIALTEFWWGRPNKNMEKLHKCFYPACKDKCRPILEYMLEDKELFRRRYFSADEVNRYD